MQITPLKMSKATTEFSHGMRKEELVRLMMQSLSDLGYRKTACNLQNESGINLEPEVIILFRERILAGKWNSIEILLEQLPLINPKSLSKVKFLLGQQKFLELLEQKEYIQALRVLRNELKPLGEDIEQLHRLSGLMMCSSVEEIKSEAKWDGINGTSRETVLLEVQKYVDSSVMIPNQRLLTLLDQAIEWQKDQCFYHNTREESDISLFSDHKCDRDQLPFNTIKVLDGHDDEIWHIAYSNNGKFLASLSKSEVCIVWNMETLTQAQSFKTLVKGSYCVWSPDDSVLVICGLNSSVRLWDPYKGSLLKVYSKHEEQVTSCAWLLDNQNFITASFDCMLYVWSVDSETPLSQLSVGYVTEMKIASDGKKLVTIGLDRYITIYTVQGINIIEIGKVKEEGMITSLSITKDGKFALVNVQEVQEIHMWDLETLKIVHRYYGQRQREFVIRSTIGGLDESLIISGSEDNRVYIWSRDQETLFESLEGHTKSVNCISWCPTKPAQYVSAGDDSTIRVWGVKT